MGKTAVQERKTKIEATAVTQVSVTESPDTPVCQHHWVIASPQGATSMGRCKRCNEEREFRNSASDHIWEDESSKGYNPWRGVRSTPAASTDDEVAASPRSGDAIVV